jgi:hypothetical protein
MKESDKKRFGLILVGVAEVYGKELSKQAASIWFNILKEYEIETISLAFTSHISNPDTGQFFPKPADIIKAIGGTNTDASFIAWTKVDQAMKLVGPYRSVVFDDPIIHAVIDDMGGWIFFGEKDENEWPFIGNDFQKRYKGYKERNSTPAHNKKLVGIHEAGNRKDGFEIEKPFLIGDKEKAKKVFLDAPGKQLEVSFAGTIQENVKQIEK